MQTRPMRPSRVNVTGLDMRDGSRIQGEHAARVDFDPVRLPAPRHQVLREVGMALLEVFDSPATGKHLVRKFTGSMDRFGHEPGH